MAFKMLWEFSHDASNKIQEDIDSRRASALAHIPARFNRCRHRGFLRVRRRHSRAVGFLRRVIKP